jgi:hypothetical protein
LKQEEGKDLVSVTKVVPGAKASACFPKSFIKSSSKLNRGQRDRTVSQEDEQKDEQKEGEQKSQSRYQVELAKTNVQLDQSSFRKSWHKK